MIRTRLTWVVVGALVALVVVAGIDALRSSEGETTASPATSTRRATTTGTASATATGPSLPACTREDIAVSVEVRRPNPDRQQSRPVAAIVMRGIGARQCFQDFSGVLFTIEDGDGMQIGSWQLTGRFGGEFAPGVEQTFFLPGVGTCDRPGPCVALATVGDYSARRGDLSREEITC
jgi:hypothetical protein